jgi:hypothetical protein
VGRRFKSFLAQVYGPQVARLPRRWVTLGVLYPPSVSLVTAASPLSAYTVDMDNPAVTRIAQQPSNTVTEEPAMSRLETMLTRIDEHRQDGREDDVYAVLASVPWARESLSSYVAFHRPDLEGDVLACICELLAA